MYGFPIILRRCSTKRTHPTADRNCKPISEAFLQQVDLRGIHLKLLEISAGYGQHAGYLAPLTPNITFYTSEYDRSMFSSIKGYAADCATKNIREPWFIDISKHPNEWVKQYGLKNESFDYLLNINMLHITPWSCAIGLFQNAGYLLKPNGKLFTYGAYIINGVLEPQSNINFDKYLRSCNSDWGIRDVADLKKLGVEYKIELLATVDMPSNNKFLIWQKRI
ncbi:UPF0585 protein CG18661 isoform X2 [Eurosta solidaginis]